jgi:hypothetical protein
MTAREIELMNLILELERRGVVCRPGQRNPGRIQSGKNFEELRGNIREAYDLVLAAKETRLAV